MQMAVLSALPHWWGYAPAVDTGPRALGVNLTWAEGDEPVQDVDLFRENVMSEMPFVQSIWIDNADNPNPLRIITDAINQRIIFPSASQGIRPMLIGNPTKFTVQAVPPGVGEDAFTVRLILLNVPAPIFTANTI
jgi:hypothetical protein